MEHFWHRIRPGHKSDVLYGFRVFMRRESEFAKNRLNAIMLFPEIASEVTASAMNVMLPLQFMSCYTAPGDVVLDLMCGSGAVAVAAAYAGRSTISIDKRYEAVRRSPFVLLSVCGCFYVILSCF